jgi:cephalosporin hydroxylase
MGLGSFIYKNRIVQQHKNVQDSVKKLLTNVKPARVIEIGTSHGGFTILLRDTLNELDMEHVPLHTFDIQQRVKDASELNDEKNIIFEIRNIFEYTKAGTVYVLACEKVKRYIQEPGPTVIFVDGGNKKAEFACLADYIKSGDVMLAHDYIQDHKTFEESYKDKIWNWCEVTEADLKASCEKNNLVPYMHEEMKSVIWGCKIKK